MPRKRTLKSEERKFKEYMKELNRVSFRDQRKFRKKVKAFEDEFRDLVYGS